jgi:hypothetical protein
VADNEKPLIRPSEAATALYMNAGKDSRMARAHLGVGAMLGGSLESAGVLLSLLKREPQLATELTRRLDLDIESWRLALSADHEPEPQPDPRILSPDATAEQRKLFEMTKETSGPAAFSKPLVLAMRQARNLARESGEVRFTMPQLVAALLETDCVAAQTLRALANPNRIEEALAWLRGQPDSTGSGLASVMSNTRELLDKIWPSIRSEANQRMADRGGTDRLEQKNREYEENPDLYEKPLDVWARYKAEVRPEHRFVHCAGVWMRAAENEARIRRAPEVQLDHLFFALLQDGSDTSQLLDRRGVNRAAMRAQLDLELPRFDEGPRWPPNARDLGMNVPSGGMSTIQKKEIPDKIEPANLTKEELAEYVEVKRFEEAFSDLYWLVGVTREPNTIGYKQLSEAGVTEDLVRAEIEVFRTGDPDWYKVRPSLHTNGESSRMHMDMVLNKAVLRAATFEARSRWAPEIEFEDVLLALLVDGTDTSKLMDDLGVDRAAFVTEIRAGLPEYAAGPFFPPEHPHLHLTGAFIGQGPTSDLKALESAFNRQERVKEGSSVGIEKLRRHGVSLEAIQTRLRELGVETSDL